MDVEVEASLRFKSRRNWGGMTSKSNADQSPNDALAEQVVNKLVEAGLISNTKVAEIMPKVKAGTASSEDWKLWIELGQAKQPGGKDGAG